MGDMAPDVREQIVARCIECALTHTSGLQGGVYARRPGPAPVTRGPIQIRVSSFSGEIAYLLGFGAASSFTRAFRRWEGASPSEFHAKATKV
jgi:hypothetical protein